MVLQSAGAGGLLADQPRGFSADRELNALSVEARVGVVLRLAFRLRGEEFAEGTFRLELPGVQFRRVEDR